MKPVTVDRWHHAQRAEAEWWKGGDDAERAQRRREIFRDAPWEAGVLGISHSPMDTHGHILDIGGGPVPLAISLRLPVKSLTVLDPLAHEDTYDADADFPVTRIYACAEDWRSPDVFTECWGYNVLQHVRDPAEVIATARRAANVVRWLDWTGTAVSDCHPHVMTSADWLLQQFAGWNITLCTTGTVKRPEWTHHFVAIVAERP